MSAQQQGSHEPAAPPGPRRSRMRRWGWVIAAIVVIAGLIIALVLTLNRTENTPPLASPVPSTSATPVEPEPTDTPTGPAPIDPAGIVPAECSEIFSPAMLASTAEAYGPVATGEEGRSSSKDEELEALMEPLPGLRCSWAPPGDAGGINTTVLTVDPVTAEKARQRLAATGFECRDYAAGTLCTKALSGPGYIDPATGKPEPDEEEIPRTGESHFLRDGLWVGTFWAFYVPEGYTEDIIATLDARLAAG